MRPLSIPFVSNAVFFLCSTLAAPVFAQGAPEVPQPSPKARVEQHVGIADLSIEYSSPGVKNRKIWGGLVPFDKPWRTGANAATKLTSSHAFSFGDKTVPAGTYALYTIPGKAAWTVVLSSDVQGNVASGLDPKADVARVTVKPTTGGHRERLTFLLADTTDDSVRVDMEWEKLRVGVPLKFDTRGQVMAGIDASLNDVWRPHFTAARWLLESGGSVDQALVYAEQSIAIKPTWRNHYLRGQVLAKQGKDVEAVSAAEKAQELGKGDDFYNYFKDEVEKSIAAWKKKHS